MKPIVEATRAYQRRMLDASCTVVRPDPDGGETWDESLGDYVPDTIEVYSGPCRIASPSASPREVEAGARTHLVRRLEIHVPHDSGVEVDDDLTVDDSPDPSAVGLELRVVGVPRDDWTAVRPVTVEEAV